MNFDKPMAEDELARYRGLIQKRLSGQPVAYLVGKKEFWSLPLQVDKRVLIPRPDTETLVQVVLDSVKDRLATIRIADIATGSGAVAIALASELANAEVVATDVSQSALVLAQENAQIHGVTDRVQFYCGDLCDAIPGDDRFDMVVSNPPYVTTAEIADLSAEVRTEPKLALDGGEDGLDLVRRLIKQVGAWIHPGGFLALEHGYNQGASVRELIAAEGGFEPAETKQDLAGYDRVTLARRT